MKTKDFLKKYDACPAGARWALSISGDIVDVWDAMIEQGKHEWLVWAATRPGVFSDSSLRKIACRFVRETPLAGGRTVWDLLTDERSRRAVEVAERYADGKATEQELNAARDAAYAADRDVAAYAAYVAADDASFAARVAADAAYAAARAAAAAAARAAYAAYAADAAAFAADAAAFAADAAAYAARVAAVCAADATVYAAAARAAARAAAYAARVAADGAAAYDAADDATDAARAAVKEAHVRMIAEMGNPFKERA